MAPLLPLVEFAAELADFGRRWQERRATPIGRDVPAALDRLLRQAEAFPFPEPLAKVKLILAEHLVDRGADSRALETIGEVKMLASRASPHGLYVSACTLEVQIRARQKDWDSVLRIAGVAVPAVEAYRAQLKDVHLQAAYLRDRLDLYRKAAEASLALGRLDDAIRWAELSKGADIFDHVEPDLADDGIVALRAELEDVSARLAAAPTAEDGRRLAERRRMLWAEYLLRARRSAAAARAAPDPGRLRAALAPDQALLHYFWLSPDRLLVVAMDAAGANEEIRTLTPAQVETLRGVARAVQRDEVADHDDLASLSAILWPRDDAVAGRLAGRRRLIVAPHLHLHALPFHAFTVGGRPLIDSHAITYVPGLGSLLSAPAPAQDRRGLVVGIGRYGDPALKPLPRAHAEASSVERLWREEGFAVARAADDVERAALAGPSRRDRLSRLHFVAHAEAVTSASDTPFETRLHLGTGALDGIDVMCLGLGADLVFLNACSSGQRALAGRGMDELPGDDPLGFQAAFRMAGTRALVCALWPVEDEAAHFVAERFYSALARCRDEALALQAALRELRATRRRARCVEVWAPFTLTVFQRRHRDGAARA